MTYKQNVYIRALIRAFADAATEKLFASGTSRLKWAMMRLVQFDSATRLDDLRLPASNRLEAMRGDRAGSYSIRVNDRRRVCFRFENGDAWDVEIVDYH
ncbi:MAG TPA: type II toxin-antitoxin system RelE/ParE family toxin [Rhizomicrobium sp.]|nr:type II toxin-antitoxin system RelE/ParE family toxin [Rhizomicrobium sp.]